jgi:RNA 2',3'-cyclic 3'-phosphodiesterase
MRLFIAIEIDKAIRQRIENVRSQLRSQVAAAKGSIKWVESENTHLTLNFLGETADNQVTDICRIVEETAKNHSPFELEVRGLGTFGSPARVVWVGITENPGLTALQADLRDAFEKNGLAAENREYSGHLTLCRIKAPSAGYALREKIEKMPIETYGTSFADSVCVFESRLSKAGPAYTIVRRVELKQ